MADTATPVPEGGEEDFDLFGPGPQVPEGPPPQQASLFLLEPRPQWDLIPSPSCSRCLYCADDAESTSDDAEPTADVASVDGENGS